jgi:hypothetical protein
MKGFILCEVTRHGKKGVGRRVGKGGEGMRDIEPAFNQQFVQDLLNMRHGAR